MGSQLMGVLITFTFCAILVVGFVLWMIGMIYNLTLPEMLLVVKHYIVISKKRYELIDMSGVELQTSTRLQYKRTKVRNNRNRCFLVNHYLGAGNDLLISCYTETPMLKYEVFHRVIVNKNSCLIDLSTVPYGVDIIIYVMLANDKVSERAVSE